MTLPQYQENFPEHLAPKVVLNRCGMKPISDHVAVFVTDKGYSYPLFEISSTQDLSLTDSNAELILWREGLKGQDVLTIKDQEWIQKIESRIKEQIVETHSDKEEVSLETIYFNHEYPIDKMGKPSELNRMGLRGVQKVAAYLSSNSCSPLYSYDSAIPLSVESATKKEKTYWLEGLKSGILGDLSEENRNDLVAEIKDSLENKLPKSNNPGKSKAVQSDESKASFLKKFKELQQRIEEGTPQLLFLSIVGSGISLQDEVLQASILTTTGEVIYNQYFKPENPAEIIQLEPLVDGALNWSQEWPHIEALIKGKELLIYNPEYEMKIFEQTCQKHGVKSLELMIVNLKPIVQSRTGFSSLEGGIEQLDLQINKSDLVFDSHLTCLVLFAIFNQKLGGKATHLT